MGYLIEETTETGTLIKDYIWQEGMYPVAQIDNTTGTEQVLYLYSDHLMTNRLATDQNQNVVWRWEGEAFGNMQAQELAGFDINLRFPGQYFDEETNLHYNYFRYYDPELGRYITSDPIGLNGRFNTYSYVNQNPSRLVDILGLYCSFIELGEPDYTPTGNRRSVVTKEWQDIDMFPVPVPSNPGPGDFPRRGGGMPGPSWGVIGQTTYYEEGYWEAENKVRLNGVLKCWDNCGKLVSEIPGGKDGGTTWLEDGPYNHSYTSEIFGPITSPANPGDLPPTTNRRRF